MELFDKDDKIIMPVTVPISITVNLAAHDFDYIAVQVETYDPIMREVLSRWANGELIQYRCQGRFGTQTGDVNSVYAYDDNGSGEFTLYGRSHKEIMRNVLGFIDPSVNAVQRTYAATHKLYSGSALAVVRSVLTDNLVNRIGVPMTFPSGDLGNHVEIDFRFDEIYQHLYEDGTDNGGVKLQDNGNIIFDIARDFKAHRFEMTAREPTHHDQLIEVKSGLISRWEITSDRGEANRIVVGGPREMADRVFGSTEGDVTAPKTQEAAASEKAAINANIKARAKTRDDAIAALRATNKNQVKGYKNVMTKALGVAADKFNKAKKAALDKYIKDAAKAKTDYEKDLAKTTRDSTISGAKSTWAADNKAARDAYNASVKTANTALSTGIKNANSAYATDVATQKDLLNQLMREWPYPNRRFPAEMFTEDTSPEGIASDDLNPEDPQRKLDTIDDIADELNKYAVTKMAENGQKGGIVGEMIESDVFYLGNPLKLGDYVRLGVDETLELGEQQIEKVTITWTKDDGYKVEITRPDGEESTEEATLKKIISSLKELSTRTRRR